MGFIKNLFSNPKPPPPPDYEAIGEQQQEANVEAVRLGARLKRPDIYTPEGTTTWGEPSPDRWRVTQTYAPEVMAARQRERSLMGQLQGSAAQRIGELPTGPLDLAGVRAEPGAFDYGTLGAAPRFAWEGIADAPVYDTSGATYELPSYSDLNTYTTDAADRFFTQATGRLNPQFDRAETALRTQLINTGIPEGSDAYNREMNLFTQRKSDALSDLATDAIFKGQRLGTNILGDVLAGRGQQLGEIGASYDVARGARQQQLADEASRYEMGLAARERAAREGIFGVEDARTQRDREIQEARLARALPLSEATQLLTGTTPQAQAPPRIQGVQGPVPVDLAGLANMRAQHEMAAYQGRLAQQQGAMDLVGGVLGSWAGTGFQCWVAREVYGASNPKWLLFRHWLTTQSPRWFHNLYLRHGPAWAAWLHNRPIAKAIVRWMMDRAISSLDSEQIDSALSIDTDRSALAR